MAGGNEGEGGEAVLADKWGKGGEVAAGSWRGCCRLVLLDSNGGTHVLSKLIRCSTPGRNLESYVFLKFFGKNKDERMITPQWVKRLSDGLKGNGQL